MIQTEVWGGGCGCGEVCGGVGVGVGRWVWGVGCGELGVGSWVWGVGCGCGSWCGCGEGLLIIKTLIDFTGFCASKNLFMHSHSATDNVCACVEE